MAEPDAPPKLLIEKGVINPRRVYTEDFRGAGNISEIIGSHAAMNIVEILIGKSSDPLLVISVVIVIGC